MLPSDPQKTVRVGCGSGFAMDRIEPGLALAESGAVDYMGFDALAERTIAMAHLRRKDDPGQGYDTRLRSIISGYAPHIANGVKLVGNFGGANVEAGAGVIAQGLRDAGYRGIRFAAIQGDDIHQRLHEIDPLIPDLGQRVSELGDREGPGRRGADLYRRVPQRSVCLCGADLSRDGWSMTDLDRVTHLLECSTQVSLPISCRPHSTTGSRESMEGETARGTKFVPLRSVAYSRSGDKGNISNISVIAYEAKDWELIREQVTVEAVARIYAGLYDGRIARFELPVTRALNFVIEGALASGVSVSLRVDPHGKSMQSLILGWRYRPADITLGQPAEDGLRQDHPDIRGGEPCP